MTPPVANRPAMLLAILWLKLPVGNIRPVGVLEERVRLDGVGILWSAAESLLLLAL